MKPASLSRRGFAATALSTPAVLAQQVPSTPSEAIVQNPPLSNRLPPTSETMPFAEALVNVRLPSSAIYWRVA